MNKISQSERQAGSERAVFDEFCLWAGLVAKNIRPGKFQEPDIFCLIDEDPRYFEITYGTDQELMEALASPQKSGYIGEIKIVEGVARTLNKKFSRRYLTVDAQRIDLLVYLEHSDCHLMPRLWKGTGLEESILSSPFDRIWIHDRTLPGTIGIIDRFPFRLFYDEDFTRPSFRVSILQSVDH